MDSLIPKMTKEILQDARTLVFTLPKHDIYYGKLLGKLYAREFFTLENIIKDIEDVIRIVSVD